MHLEDGRLAPNGRICMTGYKSLGRACLVHAMSRHPGRTTQVSLPPPRTHRFELNILVQPQQKVFTAIWKVYEAQDVCCSYQLRPISTEAYD